MLVVEALLFLPALIAPGIIRAPLPKISEATNNFYPWHVFWRDEVLAGRLPFWNPFKGGYYFSVALKKLLRQHVGKITRSDNNESCKKCTS